MADTTLKIPSREHPWAGKIDPFCARCGHLLSAHTGHLFTDPCGVTRCGCEFACYQPDRTQLEQVLKESK